MDAQGNGMMRICDFEVLGFGVCGVLRRRSSRCRRSQLSHKNSREMRQRCRGLCAKFNLITQKKPKQRASKERSGRRSPFARMAPSQTTWRSRAHLMPRSA